MTAREIVRSRANPAFQRLLECKRRARAGQLVLVEGATLLGEAQAAGLRLHEAAVSESLARSPRGRALLRALLEGGAAVRIYDDALVQALAEVETSQGVLALAEPPRFDEARLFAGTPLVLAACGIQNPGNLGGLLRTAEAAGATGAVLAEGTADPLSWKSLRGSMGSAFRLPQLRRVRVSGLVALLKERGLRTIAADARAPRRYDEIDWRGPVALLLGGEAAGLPAEVLEQADERVAVPLAAPVESLNVGVAAGVLLFEAARQRRPVRVLQSRAKAERN